MSPPSLNRAPHDIALDRFDRALQTERYALLRLGAHWTVGPSKRRTPTLEVECAGCRRQLLPLPQPQHTAGWSRTDARTWWAGYAVPVELADDPRTRFFLTTSGGLRLALGAPHGPPAAPPAASRAVARLGRAQLIAMTAITAVTFASVPVTGLAQAGSRPSSLSLGSGEDGQSDPTLCPATDPAAGETTSSPTDGATVPTDGATVPTDGATSPDQCDPPADPTDPPPADTTDPPPADTTAPVPAPADTTAPAPPPADTTAPVPPPTAPAPAPPSSPAVARPTHPAAAQGAIVMVHSAAREPSRKQASRRHRGHATDGAAPAQGPALGSGGVPAGMTPSDAGALVTGNYSALLPAPLDVSFLSDRVLKDFDVPPFLLPIYQAAGMEYGVPWQVLAAINAIETDYGRNRGVSSAGAVGWMQFMPATWKLYGLDANLDGQRDPANPTDAIFAAARYLSAAGAATDLRQAIFAYNHAGWYVDDVLARARSLSQMPGQTVDALTALAQARFPVPGSGVEYSRVPAADGSALLHAPAGRPVIAVADARVVSMGHDARRGHFIELRDAYGNRFTYDDLGRLERRYSVPRPRSVSATQVARELHLPHRDPRPQMAATQDTPRPALRRHEVAAAPTAPRIRARVSVGEVLAARIARDPRHPAAAMKIDGARLTALPNPSLPNAAKPRGVFVQKTLRRGARVPAGTVLGTAGAAAVRFAVNPAGSDSPTVDPTPLLDGWKLLASTGASGRVGLASPDASGSKQPPIGQTMLLSDQSLARRVLGDPNITIYECGRQDILAGLIDRRVLGVLAYLSAAGLHPTVSALQCGHSLYTTSGNISEHSTGDAVDIAAINGTPIVGHQGPGSITETTISRLLQLQGAMVPHQIISLMTFQGAPNTMAMANHYDHIHVGYHPVSGGAPTTGGDVILRPSQWSTLMGHLAKVRNPRVSSRASRWALPAGGAKSRKGA